MFRRSVVLMDGLAPHRGAFPHALDVAHRLQIPVRGFSSPAWIPPGKSASPEDRRPAARGARPRAVAWSGDHAPARPDQPVGEEEARACAKACSWANVPWEWSPLDSLPGLALRRDVAPDDLLVFDQGLPAVQKQDLFRQALRDQAPAVLVCPATWVPLSRVLVVDQKDTPEEVFLRRAAALCRGLGTDSIVLTVARTERAARLRQATARETLAGAGLDADFDFLVGAEVRGAVASIARWRRCQLVVMRRQDCPPWWRWLRDPHAEWMMNLTESLSFLSLPGTAASVLPAPTPVVAPAPREPSFAPVPAARRAPAANEPLR